MSMKKISLLLAFLGFIGLQVVFAQTRDISGTVTSADDGSSIPGASVVVKGTTIGTVTDMDGKFALRIPASAKSLMISFVGMSNTELPITGSAKYAIKLKSENISVNEVVVTAMGITKEKKALGYAVQDVKSDELTQGSNSDLSGALQGKISGVEITPSSGMPGASSKITIRGSRSFTGDNTPLYVVDGMPISSANDVSTGNSVTGTDFANRSVDIDPNDIESVNILKGQAASALYGMRASNGVVVITTKSGKSARHGKPEISFNSSVAYDVISVMPDLQKVH